MTLIKSFVPHSRCFGSYFDVIFLMYLVSSGFSFKPTSSSSSSSSTQFSQEWARRKVVVKHSIKSNPVPTGACLIMVPRARHGGPTVLHAPCTQQNVVCERWNTIEMTVRFNIFSEKAKTSWLKLILVVHHPK